MAERRKADACDFMSDGRVKLVFGGHVRTLRRPTIGELKHFNKALVDMAIVQPGQDPDPNRLDEMLEKIIEWWREVLEKLRDEDDEPCPVDADDFPTWMVNADLLVNMQTHWREVPWASGGK